MDCGSCPFCNVIAGRVPTPDRYETCGVGVVCFRPLHPHGDGHRLFVPRRHVYSAGEDPALAGLLVEIAAQWANEHGVIEFNIITSVGTAATQTVPHLHVHLVPRTPDDGEVLPWGRIANEHRLADQPTF